jgi:arginine-tRNA-protein transferase
MFEIWDGPRLIAVGVFDLGENSIAGILNFYDPDYKKFSLSKCLILKKMEFALNSGRDWYYPGYIGYKLPKFDYKLDPGFEAAEILDPFSRHWFPYSPELVEELALLQHPYFFPPEELEEKNKA